MNQKYTENHDESVNHCFNESQKTIMNQTSAETQVYKIYLGTLCKRNHRHNNTKKSLRYKSGACVICAKQWKKKKSTKINIKTAVKAFEKHGCTLLHNGEITSKSMMVKYKCKCGNINHKRISYMLQSGNKKKECKKCPSPNKHSYKTVKQMFKEKGLKLLSKEYISNSHYMKYRCTCGEIGKTPLRSLPAISGCRKCEHIRRKANHNKKRIWFNDDLFLGTLCPYKHNYENSGKSLRSFKNNYGCVNCMKFTSISRQLGLKIKPKENELIDSFVALKLSYLKLRKLNKEIKNGS